MQTRIFDPSVILSTLPELLSYLSVTLLVAFASVFFGSVFGMVLAKAKLGNYRLLKGLAHGYTYIMRCTPSIVLLFIVFYGLPKLAEAFTDLNLHEVNRAVYAIITFTLLFGAYISEVFRAAYQAVPKGQYEAAVSIGLTPFQAFRQVMLPQAAVVALPNFGNSLINLMKEGALAYTIGLIDMLGKANLIIAQNFGAYGVEIYLAAMLVYWGLTTLVGQGFNVLEAHLSKGQVRTRQTAKVRVPVLNGPSLGLIKKLQRQALH